jgi:hypothetical protein
MRTQEQDPEILGTYRHSGKEFQVLPLVLSRCRRVGRIIGEDGFRLAPAEVPESEHYTGRYDIMVADLTTQVAHVFSIDEGSACIR